MAQNVIINGVTYSNVPSVKIPLAGGSGDAIFVDTAAGDAVADDLRNGKKAYVDGVEITGSKPVKSASDITVSGKNVTIPAGIYDAQAQKSVADGAATPNVTVTGDEIGTTASDYPVVVTPKATVGTPGYISTIADGAAVTKYIQVEEKTATPSGAVQTITPTAGKLLKKVSVAAVVLTGNAQPSDVLNGKTFYNSSLIERTGTATVPTVSQDSTTKILSIA